MIEEAPTEVAAIAAAACGQRICALTDPFGDFTAATGADVDAAMRAPLPSGAVRIIHMNRYLPPDTGVAESFGTTVRYDAALVARHLRQGDTISVRRAERFMPRVASLCRAISERLAQPAKANLYLTPPRAQGLPTHADDHDVLVFQCEGVKYWSFGTVGCEIRLAAHDLLFVEAGIDHAARSGESESLHVTIGLTDGGYD